MRFIKKLAVIVAAFFFVFTFCSVNVSAISFPPEAKFSTASALYTGGEYEHLSFTTLEGDWGMYGVSFDLLWEYNNNLSVPFDYIVWSIPNDNSNAAFELYDSLSEVYALASPVYYVMLSYNQIKSNSYVILYSISGSVLLATTATSFSGWSLQRPYSDNIDEVFEIIDNAYNDGRDFGFGEGYKAANFEYDEAFKAGQLAAEEISIWGSIQNVFFGVFGLLGIEIVPGVTLGLLMFFPLILGLLFTVVSFARGFRR